MKAKILNDIVKDDTTYHKGDIVNVFYSSRIGEYMIAILRPDGYKDWIALYDVDILELEDFNLDENIRWVIKSSNELIEFLKDKFNIKNKSTL